MAPEAGKLRPRTPLPSSLNLYRQKPTPATRLDSLYRITLSKTVSRPRQSSQLGTGQRLERPNGKLRGKPRGRLAQLVKLVKPGRRGPRWKRREKPSGKLIGMPGGRLVKLLQPRGKLRGRFIKLVEIVNPKRTLKGKPKKKLRGRLIKLDKLLKPRGKPRGRLIKLIKLDKLFKPKRKLRGKLVHLVHLVNPKGKLSGKPRRTSGRGPRGPRGTLGRGDARGRKSDVSGSSNGRQVLRTCGRTYNSRQQNQLSLFNMITLSSYPSRHLPFTSTPISTPQSPTPPIASTSTSTPSSALSITNGYGKRTMVPPQDSLSKRVRCVTPSHGDLIGNHLIGIVKHWRAYRSLLNRYMAALANGDSEWTKITTLEEQVRLDETAMRGRAAVSKLSDLHREKRPGGEGSRRSRL
ncbi:hypothetical protein IAR50_004509 [Cryptococcus sp. DSM 104548]